MKFCSIICSFDSANLTRKVHDQLLNNEKHDIFILENSTTIDKMYRRGIVLDMGRKNIGFGGMNDFIFSGPRFRKYDFVGIFNNDVFDIPSDYITKIKKYLTPDVGMISSAIQNDGTSWPWMRKVHSDGARDVGHVETIATFFNTKFFDNLSEFIPYHYYGIIDISLSRMYIKYGYRVVVTDDMVIGHMLSGARKEAGVQEEYIRNYANYLNVWHDKYPEIKTEYEKYIKSISHDLAIIIPNYNHNHMLKRAVRSIIDSKIDADIIIVDDCSDESSKDIVKDLPVRWFRHDRNRGLAQTRNTAISNTIAKWILPLDADDEMLPGMLQELWDNRDRGDVIYGNLVWRGNNTTMKPCLQNYLDKMPDVFLSNNHIFGTSLYKRECWNAVKGYWEDHKEFYEDWDFWGRVAKKGFKFYYIDKDIYLYAGEPGGMCARLGKNRDYNVGLVREHIKQS